jgi:hypothetical protein
MVYLPVTLFVTVVTMAVVLVALTVPFARMWANWTSCARLTPGSSVITRSRKRDDISSQISGIAAESGSGKENFFVIPFEARFR